MKILLVCSEPDLPSVNMKASLLSKREWEDAGSDGEASFLRSGDLTMITVPDLHIYAESLDLLAGRTADFDTVVFMSRHKAASAMPTLTVHPIGNYGPADYGGRPRTLCPAAPHAMSSALRAVSRLNDTETYKVSFEVTHHGPYMETPSFFIEIGSDESHWGDTHAADILADAILDTEEHGYPAAIGVGGGHYAPRFTEAALSYKVDFGHMLPQYHIESADDEELAGMLRRASEMTGTRMAYLHRKSFSRPEARRVEAVMESEGLEVVSSKDLDPISSP